MLGALLALLIAAAPSAEAVGPAPAPAPGPRAEGDAWSVELRAPASLRGGAPGTARVVVTARGNFHVNRDYPLSFRPAASGSAVVAGERVALSDGAERTPCRDVPAEACAVSAPLRFTAAPSGETRLAGVVSFSVCNADRCLIERVPLAAVVPAR